MKVRLWRCLGGLACGVAIVSSCRVWYDELPVAGEDEAGAPAASGEGGAPRGEGGAPVSSGGAPGLQGGAASAEGGVPSSGAGVGGAAGVSAAGASEAGSGGAPDVVPRCTAPVSPITDYCTSIPRLTDAVALDGELDCGLMPIDIVPQGWLYDPADLDATARFAAAWDDGGVYFFLEVHDASPALAETTDPVWMGDSVELYVDTDGSFENPPGYDAVGTRQITIGRTHSDGSGLRGQVNAALVAGFPVDWPPQQVTVTSTDEGYVVEAYIPGSLLDVPDWQPKAGDHIGLDVAVNVSFMDPQTIGTQGHRLGQFFYFQSSEPEGEPYRNVAGFCTPVLAE